MPDDLLADIGFALGDIAFAADAMAYSCGNLFEILTAGVQPSTPCAPRQRSTWSHVWAGPADARLLYHLCRQIGNKTDILRKQLAVLWITRGAHQKSVVLPLAEMRSLMRKWNQEMASARGRIAAQIPLIERTSHPSQLLRREPVYSTDLGSAYNSDALSVLAALPSQSVNLVMTSPPYALHFKKEYGNVEKHDYVQWMLPFAQEIKRVLKSDGSFVINIGGSYNAGSPTRSLYHFKLLIALVEEVGFKLAQECFWHNPAKLPSPTEWVNVRRVRIKDNIEYVWWLSPTEWPYADNRNVLVPYSPDMKRLILKGYKAKKRPSGHNITSKFQKDQGGAIPPNVLIRGNNESNSEYISACKTLGVKVHPARFPSALPDFYIRLLTRPGDLVLDPFGGSNTTGRVAEDLGRTWISVDIEEAYVKASGVRFGFNPERL